MNIVFSVNAEAWFCALTPHMVVVPPAPPSILPHSEGAQMGVSPSQRMAMLAWSNLPGPVLLHVDPPDMTPGPGFGKIAGSVFVDGAACVQLGHDVGELIPHLGAPNPMLALHFAFSSCKVNFGKSRVLVEKTPAGTWIPALGMFQTCADPTPMPLGFHVCAFWTTVKYGFSWGDLVAGHLRCAADAAKSSLTSKLGGELFGSLAKKVLTSGLPPGLPADIAEEIIEALLKAPNWILGKVVDAHPELRDAVSSIDDVGRWVDEHCDLPDPEAAIDDLLDAIPLLGDDEPPNEEPS